MRGYDMPIYQYKAKEGGCENCQDGFELMQAMSAKELTKCPQCGGGVKKCPSMCSGFSPMLSNSNLRDKGFTKLQKRGDGSYEKMT